MSESQDGWEKVREMVRNTPPPIAEAPPPPTVTEEEPPARGGKMKWIVVILVVIGGGYAAWQYIPSFTKAVSPSTEESKSAAASTSKADAAKSTVPAPPPPEVLTIRREIGSTNVRSGPSSSHSVVTKLRGGDRVEKVSESGGWVEIRTDRAGQPVRGWVSRKVLE